MSARIRALALAVLLVMLAVTVFFILRDTAGPEMPPIVDDSAGDTNAREVAADVVDPANEGQPIRIVGPLQATGSVTDTQLGVTAEALALLRTVEMWQWQEQCTSERCEYSQQWLAQLIDSAGFRDPSGHANSAEMPFSSARFDAAEIRLGAFVVAGDLALAEVQAQALPVQLEQLPANLAASFRVDEGVLYSGDPAAPVNGDLRVRYEIFPASHAVVIGVQNGAQLSASSAVIP